MAMHRSQKYWQPTQIDLLYFSYVGSIYLIDLIFYEGQKYFQSGKHYFFQPLLLHFLQHIMVKGK